MSPSKFGIRSKRDGRRESRKMSLVRSVNIMQKQNMEVRERSDDNWRNAATTACLSSIEETLAHRCTPRPTPLQQKHNHSPNTRRASILEAIGSVPGFEGALGSIIMGQQGESTFWRDQAGKLNHYGLPSSYFSKEPVLTSNPVLLHQMANNVSSDGVYDYCGSPAFARVGQGRFEGTEREGWIEVGDGGCVKVKVEGMGEDDLKKYPLPTPPQADVGNDTMKIPEELPLSPQDALKEAAKPLPSEVEADDKFLPSGLITSFAVLSPEPKQYPPPTTARWVSSAPNKVVSTFPLENAIPQMEWFLPSYPTFLSPIPPTVQQLAR